MQARHTSWLIAGAVVLFGLIGALPFHTDPAPATTNPLAGTIADGVVWQEPGSGPALAASPLEDSFPTPVARRADESVAPVTALTALTPPASKPPEMSDEYGTLLRSYERQHGGTLGAARIPAPIPHSASKASSAAPARQVAESPRPAPLATTATQAPPAPRQFAPPIVRSLPRSEPSAQPGAVESVARRVPVPSQPVELEQHKVRDGDTLTTIAQRYLGDASRAYEIFEANRDQLSDPELLPIGKRLRIPPRFAPLPTAAPPADSPATAATHEGLSWEMRRLPAVQPVSTGAAPYPQPQTRLAPLGTLVQ